MSEIAVLAEHRRGEIREITLEILTFARRLAEKTGHAVTAIILGNNVDDEAGILAGYCDEVVQVEDERLGFFVSDLYQEVLKSIIEERRPRLLLMGHTSYGIELAPSLAVSLNVPLMTDCVNVELAEDKVSVVRPMYGGKLYARINIKSSGTVILTLSQGIAKPSKLDGKGEIIKVKPTIARKPRKKFIGYVEPERGEVDISSADVIVAVGRGIHDSSNLPMADELAKLLGGVLACSRPIVDKGWLPPDRQVGSSGKTVKPKLYMALGISGAFQHIQGMKNSQLIIAVNKDPNAPIFNIAHYGVVEDMFKIMPLLIEKIKKERG